MPLVLSSAARVACVEGSVCIDMSIWHAHAYAAGWLGSLSAIRPIGVLVLEPVHTCVREQVHRQQIVLGLYQTLWDRGGAAGDAQTLTTNGDRPKVLHLAIRHREPHRPNTTE